MESDSLSLSGEADMEDTPHSIALWCDEQDKRVKVLQDVCLDNELDEEAKKLLIRLSEIQDELKELSRECEQILFS
jgi:hypothetical protein